MTVSEQVKTNYLFSLTPLDNTLWNDFQNAYLALWKWTLQAEYCASEASRQLSCSASSVFSYWRISRKRVEDFKAAFSCHQSIPWIIDLRGRFIKQHTWGLMWDVNVSERESERELVCVCVGFWKCVCVCWLACVLFVLACVPVCALSRCD